LAVARIDRSELHCTTSILAGPSPKICMTSVPSNLRFAESSAHAAIISPESSDGRRIVPARQHFLPRIAQRNDLAAHRRRAEHEFLQLVAHNFSSVE
jgi:hypothetical protein